MAIDFLPLPDREVSIGDQIRIMTVEEIAAEGPIFAATGNPLPNPATSVFIGAFKDGKRVAFLVLQVKLHGEPLFIEPGHSTVLPGLVKFAEDYIMEKAGPQYVYVFCPAGRTAQLAQAMGMQLEPWVVLSKLVSPELPDKGVVDLSVPPLFEPEPDTEGVVQ